MKVLMITMGLLTVFTVSSPTSFARGHDIPERYEWEAQIEKIESSDRQPSSAEPSHLEKNLKELPPAQRFKTEYSNSE